VFVEHPVVLFYGGFKLISQMKKEEEIRARYEMLMDDRVRLLNLVNDAFNRKCKNKKLRRYIAAIDISIYELENILGIELPF
jgi:hypothetical protein